MTDNHLPYQYNDISLKYSSAALQKRQHQYLGLDGEFIIRYPTEVILRNLHNTRMDELYKNDLGELFNIEEESSTVTMDKLKVIAEYRDFARYMYSSGVNSIIICKKDPKNFPKEYKSIQTDILIPKYIHFTDEELLGKYEKIINKVKQKHELTDNEALDIAFIPKYISNRYSEIVTEKLSYAYRDAIIKDKVLRMDIAFILKIFILKNIPDSQKQNKLLDVINMKVYSTEMEKIIHEAYKAEFDNQEDEFNDKLEQVIKQKDQEMNQKNQEITKINNKHQKIINQKNQEITKINNKHQKIINQKDKEINQLREELEKLKQSK